MRSADYERDGESGLLLPRRPRLPWEQRARPQWMGAPAFFGGSGPATDPYFSNVIVLLHFDGTDGANTFTDVVGSSWTPTNGPTTSAAQSKFGGTSGLFPRGNAHILSAPTGLGFGSGDFTLEAWIYPIDLTSYFGIFDQRSSGLTDGVFFYISSAGQVSLEMRSNSPSYTGGNQSATGAVTAGAWQHVAVSRHVDTYYMAVNGTIIDATANGTGYVFNNSAEALIGCSIDNNAAYSANGYMDELRITKGVARYLTSYTVPTAPFPNA